MPASDLLPAANQFIEAVSAVRAVRRKRRLLAPIEKKLDAAIAKAFTAQGKAFMRRLARLKPQFPKLEEAIRDQDWEPLFDEAILQTIKAFVGPIDLFAAAALLAGGQQQIAELGVDISFDLENPRAVAFLEEYGAQRVSMINETTRSTIKSIVTQAVDEGWSYDRTAKALSDRFGEFAVGRPQQHIDSRAHLVAVTEAAHAYEAGNRMVVDDLIAAGLTMEIRWLNVGDNRVSEGCRANGAEGWIPATSTFQSGHQHPPRFPGCRCCGLSRRARK